MKKLQLLLLPLLLLIVMPNITYGQGLELTGYGGYMLGGRINFYDGYFRVQDNPVYGFALNYDVGPGVQFEFDYYRMDTKGDFVSYRPSLYPSRQIDMAVNYFQVGALHALGDGPIQPYFLGGLGAAWFQSKESDIGDTWRFAVSAAGGVKIFLGQAERIGIRLQARLDLPLYFAGIGLWCGTGGCGTSVNSVAPIVQGDFTGGLIIRLGD